MTVPASPMLMTCFRRSLVVVRRHRYGTGSGMMRSSASLSMMQQPFSTSNWASSSPVSHDGGVARRTLSSSSENDTSNDDDNDNAAADELPGHQRVWLAHEKKQPNKADDTDEASATTHPTPMYSHWTDRVVDRLHDTSELHELYHRIADQELPGGSFSTTHLGVLHQDPVTDMELLIDNYTVRAVASALRDREDALQQAAVLAEQQEWDALAEHLRIFHPKFVLERRYRGSHRSKLSGASSKDRHRIQDVTQHLDRGSIELIRKALMRMPRTVTQAHSKRAAVVIALCTVQGVPCLLLEKRARHLRAHPDEVCLPGGMVCDVQDQSIVNTSLREMEEEIGGLMSTSAANDDNDASEAAASTATREPDVLGVFRCNWGDIHQLVNVAVTPVVCFFGELPDKLEPNKDEVAKVFTVPLASLIDKDLWVHREGLAPIFVGGPEVIWGLTGYILERFAKDILVPNSVPMTAPSL